MLRIIQTALFVLLLPACLYSAQRQVRHTGDYVPRERLQQVHAGTSAVRVEQLLGAPSERTRIDDTVEVWTYRYRASSRQDTSVLLVFSDSSEAVRSGTVRVRLEGGQVVRASRYGAAP